MRMFDLLTGKQKHQPANPEVMFGLLDKPSLAALSYALRHPEIWPKHFRWDYTRCHSCAIGLAYGLWPTGMHHIYTADQLGPFSPRFYFDGAKATFGMKDADVSNIFFHPHQTKGDSVASLSPNEVADLIDTYIAQAA